MRLPDFIIIGAAKSGTTSFVRYLDQHPDVCFSKPKEPGFFYWPRINNKGLTHYAKFFEGCHGAMRVGEASTAYLYGEKTPRMIVEAIPDVRLIAILRNPVDRAFSHYLHRCGLGQETRSFKQAIEEESSLIHTNLENRTHYSYVDRGMYARQIQNYLKYFDSSQLLILLFDDLVEDSQKVVKKCFDFLGVNPNIPLDTSRKHNASIAVRLKFLNRLIFEKNPLGTLFANMLPLHQKNRIREFMRRLNYKTIPKAKIDEDIRKELIEVFRVPNEELERITNRKLNHWSKI